MNRAIASGSPQDSTDDSQCPAPRPRMRGRLPWLDLFRGAAVLVMIETHVVNTFLAASLREGGSFALLNYFNGLVAPSFLFIAGFVQGLERRAAPGKAVPYARRAWRLLGIAALGYALHFPFAELSQHRWADALRVGSQVDVLQCLALGLGLLLGIGWVAERLPQRWKVSAWLLGVAALAAAAVLMAPLAQGWTGGPVVLRAWINGASGSLFPLFPWVGFVFFGALVGAVPAMAMAQRAVGMAALALLAWFCRGTVFSAFSPAFFLERIVWVLALAAVCEWAATRRVMPAVALYAGKHSLKLYVAHLVLITSLVGAGVSSSALGLPATVTLIAAVGAVSFGVARFLDRLPEFLRSLRPASEPRIAAGVAGELPDAVV